MAIDEALRQQLIKRGEFDKVKQLEEEHQASKFSLGNFFRKKNENILDAMQTRQAPEKLLGPVQENLTKTKAAVGKFVTPLGESLGGAAAVGKIETPKKLQEFGFPKATLQSKSSKEFEKGQEETLKRETELQKQVLEQMKDPDIPNDKKLRLLTFSMQNDPNLLKSIPEADKTAKQIFGEGAVTALNTLFAVTGVGKAKATGKVSEALINLTKSVNEMGKGKVAVSGLKGAVEGIERVPLATKLLGATLRTGKAAIEGGLFGTAMALESGKTDKKDIAKEAGLIAGVSVVAPPVLGRFLKTTFGGTGKTASFVNEQAEKLIPKLKEKSQTGVKGTGNWLIDSATPSRATLRQTLAGIGEKTLRVGTKDLDTAMTDRLYPLKKFEEFVETVTGYKIINTPNSAYVKARNFGGIQGRYTVAAKDFESIVDKDYGHIKGELLGYIKGTDLLNRLKRGQKIEKGTQMEDLVSQLIDIEQKVVSKGGSIDELKAGMQAYNNFTKKNVLDEMVDSGLIAKEEADNMLKAHPDWTPHAVMDFFEQSTKDNFSKSGTINVTDRGVEKAVGSERLLADVETATLYRTQQVMLTAERNRTLNTFFRNTEQHADDLGLIKLGDDVAKKGVDIKKEGFEKISYFKDGIREEWLVPEDLGRALKSLDAEQAGLITRILKVPGDMLRAGATRLNPAFTLSNLPRDLQTASGISKYGFTREQWIDALTNLNNFNNPETRAFYKGGGAFGGIIQAEAPSASVLAASRRAPLLDIAGKPLKAIETLGEITENTTRFAVYKNAITKGMSEEMAIFEARNATIDFAKHGNVMGVFNQVMPFLNARWQGFVNTATSLKDDPTKFVRRQLFQSTYPAMYLFSHNNDYESYKNIPQWERDQNWIIMYGETDGFDNSGAPIKIPEYVKIRKGEVQAPIANAVEDYFRRSAGEDPRGVKEYLAEQVKNVSPVSMTSLGPLTTPIELIANYDMFTGSAIEPEHQEIVEGGKKIPRDDAPLELRKNRWTGETAEHLSSIGLDKIGLSPARIEFIIGKITGTAGKDLLKLVDMAQSGLDQTGMPEGVATREQMLARTPIFRTFIGSNASAELIALYELADEAKKEQALEIDIPRELEAMSIYTFAKNLAEKESPDAANKYIESLDMTKDMKNRIKRIKENNDLGETNHKQIYDQIVGNAPKLRFVIKNLNLIESKEGKNKFIEDLDITKDMKKKLRKAKEEGMLEMPIR